MYEDKNVINHWNKIDKIVDSYIIENLQFSLIGILAWSSLSGTSTRSNSIPLIKENELAN